MIGMGKGRKTGQTRKHRNAVCKCRGLWNTKGSGSRELDDEGKHCRT